MTEPGWIDSARIDTEIEALLEHDAAQAERWFLNRSQAAEGAAFDITAYKALADPEHRVPKGAIITIGVDGAIAHQFLHKVKETLENWSEPLL